MVFDEDEHLTLEQEATIALLPEPGSPDERNYGLIAEFYQQLKKNYDDRRDYWTADDFHYGEMEMKRLSSPCHNRILRWLHKRVGLVAWYKYTSEYGESYVRPALWLLALLLIFTVLYPLTGLRGAPSKSIPARTPVMDASSAPGTWTVLSYWQHGRLAETFGDSFMTALGVAAFQRELAYEPTYPWGRLLALIELVLTSTLIALFLLAVRRQFRR
jgi:hypothetical protein